MKYIHYLLLYLQEFCYAREYATPVIAMYEMAHTYKFAGLSVENLYGQTEQFTNYVIEEIRNERFKSGIGDLESRLWLVNYDGKDISSFQFAYSFLIKEHLNFRTTV